jgi:hypothetical protein
MEEALTVLEYHAVGEVISLPQRALAIADHGLGLLLKRFWGSSC